MAALTLLVLLIGCDIELNPGPKPIYPCGIFERTVAKPSVMMDVIHGIIKHAYPCAHTILNAQKADSYLICYKCNVPNHIINLHHSCEARTTNVYDPLNIIIGKLLSPTTT